MMRPSSPCCSSAISNGTGVQTRSAKQSEPEYPSEYQRDARHRKCATRESRGGQGRAGSGFSGQEAIRAAVIDEGGVVSQPLHGAAPGPGVAERVPRW